MELENLYPLHESEHSNMIDGAALFFNAIAWAIVSVDRLPSEQRTTKTVLANFEIARMHYAKMEGLTQESLNRCQEMERAFLQSVVFLQNS